MKAGSNNIVFQFVKKLSAVQGSGITLRSLKGGNEKIIDIAPNQVRAVINSNNPEDYNLVRRLASEDPGPDSECNLFKTVLKRMGKSMELKFLPIYAHEDSRLMTEGLVCYALDFLSKVGLSGDDIVDLLQFYKIAVKHGNPEDYHLNSMKVGYVNFTKEEAVITIFAQMKENISPYEVYFSLEEISERWNVGIIKY